MKQRNGRAVFFPDSLMVSLSQGKDADTSGVDPPQRLFPPYASILADLHRRFKT